MPKVRPQRGRWRYAAYWSILSIVVLALDFQLGPVIQFPALFVVPVTLAAWYSGLSPAMILALMLPLTRLYFTTILDAPWSFTVASMNAAIRFLVLAFVAVLVDRLAAQSALLSTRVEQLEGVLPLCTTCGKIRDAGQRWQTLDEYVESKHGPIESVCPECTAALGEQARAAGLFERR